MMRTYILFLVMIGAGIWLFIEQVEQKAIAERAVVQYKQTLDEANNQVARLQASKKADEQLIAALEVQRRDRERQSRESQLITKSELSDDAVSNVALPGTVSSRLQDRIHRQARKYAGVPPG